MPDRVRKLLRASRNSLRRSLDAYWPAQGENEVGEATPLLHVAHTLSSAGFSTYSEVPNEPGKERVDLLGIRARDGLVVAVEGKRLFNGPMAASMAWDLQRLLRFKLPKGGYSVLPEGAECFAVIMGTTWKPAIHEWWVDPGRDKYPRRHRSDGWQDLGVMLAQVPIVEAVGIYKSPVGPQQYLLFAVSPVPGGF